MFSIKLRNVLLGLLGLGSDVVTVTSGTTGIPGNVAADLITYLSARLLEVAELQTILDQAGDKHPLPSNSSKTIRFVREEKFAVASTPTQLSEGVPPDAQPITMAQFEATAEQYGALVKISDLAELTAKHDVVQRTMYLLALQVAETYDQLIFNVLDAATTVYRPNNRAADSNLIGTDTVAFNDLLSQQAVLQTNGARTFDGGSYVFYCAPQVRAAIVKDPDYKASVQFAAPDKLWKGEVEQLGGFRVLQTNSPAFAAVTSATAGQANKIYSSFGVGRFAYQITDLQNVRVYSVAPGGAPDPLEQTRKLGWKFAFKSIITNQTWIIRFRSAGLSSITN